MEHSIDHRPSFAQLTVDLDRDEALIAEAGALVDYVGDVDISTGARGGILSSLKRSAFGGESFFMNTYTANGSASVSLAPALPGDVVRQHVDGGLFVQSGSFLATEPAVDVDTKFGGGKSFFGGRGCSCWTCRGPARCSWRATAPSPGGRLTRARPTSSTRDTSWPSNRTWTGRSSASAV